MSLSVKSVETASEYRLCKAAGDLWHFFCGTSKVLSRSVLAVRPIAARNEGVCRPKGGIAEIIFKI